MPKVNLTITNVVGGELAPLIYGRIELDIFKKGLAKCENFIVQPQGGARFRPGTIYVNHTRLNKKAVLIPFQFSSIQAYLIEATDQHFRFYKDGAIILETAKTITAITQASPGVITSTSHGFSNGDEVYINSIAGMTRLNNRFFLVANSTTNTFTLTDVNANAINTTALSAYISGGTASRIYEISTPYLEADLERIQYTQNADTMYIVNQGYEPRKLTRSAHTNWTLATFVRTADPFTAGTKYPQAVAFNDSGRLVYGGTLDNPETFWGSQAPTTGSPQYDVFTTGTTNTDAVIFTLAPIHGKVDAINWITNTAKFMIAGTFGSLRRVYGSAEDQPIDANDITAKSVEAFGVYPVLPVSSGSSLFYIQRDGKFIRSMEFDITSDSYLTTDRTLVASHLNVSGFKYMNQQQGLPNLMWVTRNDGKVIGLTFQDRENISGWHRHYIGGAHVDDNSVTQSFARILWTGVMLRSANYDQQWFVVERKINGGTWRSIEYFADLPDYPRQIDFYTGKDNELADTMRFYNAVFEKNKDSCHLDMSIAFDGSDLGFNAIVTATPSGITTGSSITITASGAIFDSTMIGRQIWKSYDINGNGGGRAEITAYTDSTHVTAKVISAFDNTNAITAGFWYLTSDSISGLDHLEGETIQIVTDGAVHPDVTVVNGSIGLDYQASKVIAGYKYRGTIQTLNLDTSGQSGSAEAKPRNLISTEIRFLDTLGAQIGTNIYQLEKLDFRSSSNITDRPPPLYSGNYRQTYSDSWEQEQKEFIILQESPLPCNVLSMDLELNVTDEQ